jgi:hypothetical protein
MKTPEELAEHSKVTITEKGYMDVECDKPKPCPFCGAAPELQQLAHANRYGRNGVERVCVIASTGILKADTFWFKCSNCMATTGHHQSTAQAAVENWNCRA